MRITHVALGVGSSARRAAAEPLGLRPAATHTPVIQEFEIDYVASEIKKLESWI